MCGICGFVGQDDQGALSRMLRRLVRRGPDDEGRYVASGVALGVRRLCVIDPAGGHQPMSNETGTVWVVLNGEIYNYRELRDELIGKGHRFVSNCDTEVLVHLYEQEGEGGVARLRGMFAYALWDQERQKLLLVRDRLGIKPLYYAARDNQLLFASELPSLLAALSPPNISSEAVAQYLSALYVPGPTTIFEGIRELRPGELLTVMHGKVETQQYFHPAALSRATSEVRDDGALSTRFLDMMQSTVRAHLVSDVPLGLFLSGGLDSSTVLAMMRAVTNGPIRTFSIGYSASADDSYNELDSARMVARHFGTDHTEERLQPDAVTLLPQIVQAMGEPFADSSAIPTFLISQVARRSVTVALSGIGGDELFGGYPRYLGIRSAVQYARLPAVLRKFVSTRLAPGMPEGSGGRDPLGRLKRFLRDGDRPIADQYIQWMTFLPPEWGRSAFTPEFLEQAGPDSRVGDYRSRFLAWPSSDPADQAMGLDLQSYLPDDLLRMGDRLSMAHSLELRVPFCDHELLSFALTLPATVRFAGWKLKGFMREAMRALLPPSIMARAKYGFRVPLARWLREDLRDMVRDMLSDTRIKRRGIVKPEYVRWVIRTHEAGTRNLADQLYALLVLELWLQHHAGATTP